MEQLILVDSKTQQKILEEIQSLKQLFSISVSGVERNELMDSADAINYMKITRRTLYKYRKKGLPSIQKDKGKLFFYKEDIDAFLKQNLT